MKLKLINYFILAFSLLTAAISPSVLAADGQIKIAQTSSTTFPIIINKSGSYVLTSNLVVTDQTKNAIELTVNDVTLDLNGFTIKGPNTVGAGNGIYAENKYNITITNGKIWGFGNVGIDLHATSADSVKGAGHRIELVQVMNNHNGGLAIVGGVLRSCVANNNTGPILSAGIIAANSIVTNCTANNNVNGMTVYDSIVKNCTANYNNQAGIFADTNFHGGNRLEGNNVRNNYWGIYLNFSSTYAIHNVGSDNVYNFTTLETDHYIPLAGDNANYGF